MVRPTITTATLNQFQDMINRGWEIDHACEILNMSQSAMYRNLKVHGMPSPTQMRKNARAPKLTFLQRVRILMATALSRKVV